MRDHVIEFSRENTDVRIPRSQLESFFEQFSGKSMREALQPMAADVSRFTRFMDLDPKDFDSMDQFVSEFSIKQDPTNAHLSQSFQAPTFTSTPLPARISNISSVLEPSPEKRSQRDISRIVFQEEYLKRFEEEVAGLELRNRELVEIQAKYVKNINDLQALNKRNELHLLEMEDKIEQLQSELEDKKARNIRASPAATEIAAHGVAAHGIVAASQEAPDEKNLSEIKDLKQENNHLKALIEEKTSLSEALSTKIEQLSSNPPASAEQLNSVQLVAEALSRQRNLIAAVLAGEFRVRYLINLADLTSVVSLVFLVVAVILLFIFPTFMENWSESDLYSVRWWQKSGPFVEKLGWSIDEWVRGNISVPV